MIHARWPPRGTLTHDCDAWRITRELGWVGRPEAASDPCGIKSLFRGIDPLHKGPPPMIWKFPAFGNRARSEFNRVGLGAKLGEQRKR